MVFHFEIAFMNYRLVFQGYFVSEKFTEAIIAFRLLF